MELGKLSPVLEYPLQRIDHNIPAFHKELLSAWVKHELCRLRTNVPTMATDILNEPLSLNRHITLHDEVLFFKDWIAAGVIKISDICYEVVPGFLPVRAVHEILAGQLGNDGRTLDRTSRELNKIISAIPQHWTKQICRSEEDHPLLSNPVLRSALRVHVKLRLISYLVGRDIFMVNYMIGISQLFQQ